MFKHEHPYPPYLQNGINKLIVGTLPPPRFSTGELKPDDVDFCYGTQEGYLWLILGKIFNVELELGNNERTVQQRMDLLNRHHIGICDMLEYAYRKKIDASDLGISHPHFRPLIPILKEYPEIKTLLFMGGNSKGSPEYFFRKYIKKYKSIKLELVSDETPKIHQFKLGNRMIKTVSLTAPSGAANRAVGSIPLYKKLKKENPDFTTIDFRVLQYQPFFKD